MYMDACVPAMYNIKPGIVVHLSKYFHLTLLLNFPRRLLSTEHVQQSFHMGSNGKQKEGYYSK